MRVIAAREIFEYNYFVYPPSAYVYAFTYTSVAGHLRFCTPVRIRHAAVPSLLRSLGSVTHTQDDAQ
jgi:hypothetical protein